MNQAADTDMPNKHSAPFAAIVSRQEQSKLANLLEQMGFRLNVFRKLEAFVLCRMVFDLVVLDNLPLHSERSAIKRIRARSQVPIMIVSKGSHLADKIRAFDLGADEYINGQIHPDEMIARAKAVARRSRRGEWIENIVRSGQLSVDLTNMKVSVANENVKLSAKESRLLQLLATTADQTVRAEKYRRKMKNSDQASCSFTYVTAQIFFALLDQRRPANVSQQARVEQIISRLRLGGGQEVVNCLRSFIGNCRQRSALVIFHDGAWYALLGGEERRHRSTTKSAVTG